MSEPITTIKLQRREDGGLCVWSDDVPGLVLSGPDPQAIMRDVWPALEALRTYNSKAEQKR